LLTKFETWSQIVGSLWTIHVTIDVIKGKFVVIPNMTMSHLKPRIYKLTFTPRGCKFFKVYQNLVTSPFLIFFTM
jgi:hypothetical protein